MAKAKRIPRDTRSRLSVIAFSIAECDKDFRPVYSVERWDMERAAYIISRLADYGFAIITVGEPNA